MFGSLMPAASLPSGNAPVSDKTDNTAEQAEALAGSNAVPAPAASSPASPDRRTATHQGDWAVTRPATTTNEWYA
jgi:hypothetical protein